MPYVFNNNDLEKLFAAISGQTFDTAALEALLKVGAASVFKDNLNNSVFINQGDGSSLLLGIYNRIYFCTVEVEAVKNTTNNRFINSNLSHSMFEAADPQALRDAIEAFADAAPTLRQIDTSTYYNPDGAAGFKHCALVTYSTT